MGILPSHKRWATFLMRLQYVVVDELHTLRGIFGSHVAHVLRRLRRLCEHYGSDPTFFFASATIGNPGELASALCGLDVEQIVDDASPRAERVLACWQRPLLDAHSGARASANIETAELMTRFVRSGSPDARVHAEPPRRRGRRPVRAAPARGGRARARRSRRRVPGRATSPRNAARSSSTSRADGCSGSRPRTRSSSASTSAASTRSCSTASRARSRRCGNRPGGPGAPVGARPRCSSPATTSSTSGTPRTPTELTRRAPERAVVNPQNPFIVRAQVACAANEMPLTPDDERWFGPGLDDAVRDLVHADRAHAARRAHVLVGRTLARTRRRAAQRFVGRVPAPRHARASARSAPSTTPASSRSRTRARCTSIRAVSTASIDSTATSTSRSSSRTTTPTNTPRRAPPPTSRSSAKTRSRRSATRSCTSASVEVRNQVVAFQRKQISTNGVIEVRELDLPGARARHACVLVHDPARGRRGARASTPSEIIGAVHAAEHGLIGMLPLFTICDRWDVGGVSMALHPQTGQPTIFVYDGYPGRGRHRRARVRRRGTPRARDARPHLRVLLRRRLPVVRAVTEVRELERVPRQARRGRAAWRDDDGASAVVAGRTIREIADELGFASATRTDPASKSTRVRRPARCSAARPDSSESMRRVRRSTAAVNASSCAADASDLPGRVVDGTHDLGLGRFAASDRGDIAVAGGSIASPASSASIHSRSRRRGGRAQEPLHHRARADRRAPVRQPGSRHRRPRPRVPSIGDRRPRSAGVSGRPPASERLVDGCDRRVDARDRFRTRRCARRQRRRA